MKIPKSAYGLLLLSPAILSAQIAWTGSTDTDWDTATPNWTDGVNPVAFANGNNVTFGTTGAGVVNLAQAVSIGSMNVNAGGYAFVGSTEAAINLGGTGPLVINPGSGNVVEFRDFGIDALAGASRATFGGGTTVESGQLYLRSFANTAAAHEFSFGTGAITLLDGTSMRINRAATGQNHTILLQNTVNVVGNATIDAGRQTANPSLRLAGTVNLGGTLNMTVVAGGGGAATGGPHGVSGQVVIDQTSPALRAFRRTGGDGNQGFTVTGDFVDGAGGAGNALVLSTNAVTNTGRQFTMSGTGNTYAGGTIIEAATTAATAANAANGFERAIVVAAGSALGTGNVTINAGALLTLQGSGNIADTATLTVQNGGFLHLSTGVNVEVDTLLAYQESSAALVSISPGTYSVADLNTFFGNNSGGDASFYGLGDLTIIPEPSTYALIGGVFALGLVMLRRRRKA